ncbi:hypothetical protein [Cupriavidus sp. RAF12]|uniref:hypothetical protein n=1 Tax=Cupriavidus sp. RAF12 TaxID=3233050 RepID=UPI003F930039
MTNAKNFSAARGGTGSLHPLEDNAAEQAYATTLRAAKNHHAIAAYRRAVEQTTGYLPTWLQRKRTGPKPKFPTAAEAL